MHKEQEVLPLTKSLGKAIKLNRIKRDWSIDDLAKKVGSSQGYLSEVERGKYSPGLKLLYRIANAFEIKLSKLIAEAEEMENETTGN